MTASSDLPSWLVNRTTMFDRNQSSTAQDIQLGAQLAQQAQEMRHRNQQMAMQQEAMRLKMEGNRFLAAGSIELGRLMEEGGRDNLYADPGFTGRLWAIGQKYPQLLDTDVFKGAIKVTENAITAKTAYDRLQHERTPADVLKTEHVTRWRAEADAARAAGDLEKEQTLRRNITLLEGTMLAPTETIETFTDDLGNQGFRVIRGGTGAGMEPTTAAKTDLQKRMLNFENMSGMSKRLLEALGPLDVGIAGWGQQVLVNEGLAQVFPGLSSQSTTDARALLGTFNESMIKALKADSQVNKQEEQRILSVLPKAGPNESLPSATAKIVRAMRELHSLSLPVAKRLGQPAPAFPLSANEIKALVKAGKLERGLAKEILNNYHPDALSPFQQSIQPGGAGAP